MIGTVPRIAPACVAIPEGGTTPSFREIALAREFYFSARENEESGITFRNPVVSMGCTVHIDEYLEPYTTEKRAKDTIAGLAE